MEEGWSKERKEGMSCDKGGGFYQVVREQGPSATSKAQRKLDIEEKTCLHQTPIKKNTPLRLNLIKAGDASTSPVGGGPPVAVRGPLGLLMSMRVKPVGLHTHSQRGTGVEMNAFGVMEWVRPKWIGTVCCCSCV